MEDNKVNVQALLEALQKQKAPVYETAAKSIPQYVYDRYKSNTKERIKKMAN